MDPKTYLAPLRSLSVLTLVVTTEPLDAAEALASVVGPRLIDQVRAVTRRGMHSAHRAGYDSTCVACQGLMDIREYIGGASLRYYEQRGEPLTPAQMLEAVEHHKATHFGVETGLGTADGERRVKMLADTVSAIDTALAQDPKDQQYFYFMPDLWPALSEPSVMAAVQRLRDQRNVDDRCIKLVIIPVPSLDYVPAPFRETFTVIQDTGLTEAQAKVKFDFILQNLGYLTEAEKREQTEYDAIVKLCTGLTTSQVWHMVASAIVDAAAKQQRGTGGRLRIMAEPCVEWRKSHGKAV